MKKLSVILFALLSGCAGLPQPKTPDEIASNICPKIKAINMLLSTAGDVDPALKVRIAVVSPIVDSVCASTVSVTALNLNDLADSALPVLKTAISESTIESAAKNTAVADISILQVLLAH